MSKPGPFSGVYPILYAFFDADGRIDEAAMRLQTEACIETGCHGIAVLGNVTEAGKVARRVGDRIYETYNAFRADAARPGAFDPGCERLP